MNDLLSFAPGNPQFGGEPSGVAVVGMPANLMATASEHTASGVLFDLPITVQFTPIEFVFSHGDGTSRTALTGGDSWANLGQAQFTPTATSHVYAERGTYQSRATVRYQASIDLGNGWFSIPGTLDLTSADYTVEVVAVHTALVARTCVEDPGGPGC